MNLHTAISIFAGGPGSGCNPDKGKCGRKPKGDSNVPKVFYHGTTSGRWKSIKKEGLRPNKPVNDEYGGVSWSSKIFVTPNRQEALQYAQPTQAAKKAGERPVLLKIKLPASMLRKLQEVAHEPGNYSLPQHVPVRYIKRISAGGPGSGCNPDKGRCGRKPGSGKGKTAKPVKVKQIKSTKDALKLVKKFAKQVPIKKLRLHSEAAEDWHICQEEF